MSESKCEIYCDLNRNELGEYASICANTDQFQKQFFTCKKITVLQISENFQESNSGGILF